MPVILLSLVWRWRFSFFLWFGVGGRWASNFLASTCALEGLRGFHNPNYFHHTRQGSGTAAAWTLMPISRLLQSREFHKPGSEGLAR